jgi:hypothetical protein
MLTPPHVARNGTSCVCRMGNARDCRNLHLNHSSLNSFSVHQVPGWNQAACPLSGGAA